VDAFGHAAAVLRTQQLRVGERLTGWVASHRQVIVNSDAALDLPPGAVVSPALASCLSVPLVDGGTLAGVLTVYAPAANAFTDDQGRLLQMVAPHIAQAMLLARQRAEHPGAQTRDLKLVSSR
jgi:GAF domain-containing protein